MSGKVTVIYGEEMTSDEIMSRLQGILPDLRQKARSIGLTNEFCDLLIVKTFERMLKNDARFVQEYSREGIATESAVQEVKVVPTSVSKTGSPGDDFLSVLAAAMIEQYQAERKAKL